MTTNWRMRFNIFSHLTEMSVLSFWHDRSIFDASDCATQLTDLDTKITDDTRQYTIHKQPFVCSPCTQEKSKQNRTLPLSLCLLCFYTVVAPHPHVPLSGPCNENNQNKHSFRLYCSLLFLAVGDGQKHSNGKPNPPNLSFFSTLTNQVRLQTTRMAGNFKINWN